MTRIISLIAIIFTSTALFAGSTPPPGPVDPMFDNYVAVGDSLTHGMQSACVDETRQPFSFGNRLASLMETDFVQALLKFPGYYVNFEDIGKGNIAWYEYIIPVLGGERLDDYDDQGILNNFGIAGATVADVLYTDGGEGGFYKLVLGESGDPSLAQALRRNPTFMTLWLGNNDTLGSAVMTTVDNLTAAADFQAQYAEVVRRINATSSVQGVCVANLPDVTAIAYLQPANDPDVPAGSLKAFWNTNVGGDDEVLDPGEIATISARTNTFNSIIEGQAAANGWAFFDINSLLSDIVSNGYQVRDGNGNPTGIVLHAGYLGGLFSLDGVHLTTTAYSAIANFFAEAINDQYNTGLGRVNELSVLQNDDTLYNDPYDPRGLINGWFGQTVQFFVELFI